MLVTGEIFPNCLIIFKREHASLNTKALHRVVPRLEIRKKEFNTIFCPRFVPLFAYNLIKCKAIDLLFTVYTYWHIFSKSVTGYMSFRNKDVFISF